jgi:hypothetical protein
MEFADETPVRRLEVVRARRASSTDLGHLYERRAEAFAGVAASICGEAAPDAVHDAFVRALARVRTLRSRGALEDWVWRDPPRVCWRLCLLVPRYLSEAGQRTRV